MIKRMIDIIISLIGILVLLPFLPFIWIVVRLNSNGSVLIKEERVGKNDKIIKLHRFKISQGRESSEKSACRGGEKK